jgi:hypothetical protein
VQGNFALAASAATSHQGNPFHATLLNIMAKVPGFTIDFFPDT